MSVATVSPSRKATYQDCTSGGLWTIVGRCVVWLQVELLGKASLIPYSLDAEEYRLKNSEIKEVKGL